MHHHIALLMLESLEVAGIEPGRFSHLRAKFESHALSTMRAPIGTGALKIVVIETPLKVGVPFGHMGMDGWSLAWYYPWAWHDAIPKQIWRVFGAPAVPLAEITTPPRTLRSPPPSQSCCTLNIPASAWIASLWPAVLQIGDSVVAAQLKAWLCTHLLSFMAASNHSSHESAAYLQEDIEWAIGNSANFLLGCSLEASGANALRQLVHHPPPRSLFRGPLIVEVVPASCSVYQAFMQDDAEMLVEIGTNGDATGVSFMLANTSKVAYVKCGSSPLSSLRFNFKAMSTHSAGLPIKELAISWGRSGLVQTKTSAERKIVLMLGVSSESPR